MRASIPHPAYPRWSGHRGTRSHHRAAPGPPGRPGVYIFRDSRRKVLYVGKARSLRKRVAGHFSSRARGSTDMVSQIADIEFIATETEAEALLAEQEFIKRHRPVFNVRLRDDKSYPYIGICLDEDFPRIYFTRERHRKNRVYFGPFSNAKRVRETLDLLGKVFMHRTCDGPQPGRASGSPCLDYYIKRCQAPCVGYISKEAYRENVETIIDFLSGRYRHIEKALDQGMRKASDGAGVRAGRPVPQQAEGGALAARAPAHLERAGGHPRRDRRGGGGHGRERAGIPDPRRRAGRPPELLPRERRAARGGRGGARSSSSSTTPARSRCRRRWWCSSRCSDIEALSERAHRAARRPGRGPLRRARRQAPHPRAGRSATRGSPWTRTASAPSAAARSGSRRSTGSSGRSGWSRSRCGSSASTSPT